MSHTQDKPLNELLSRSMVDIYIGPENTHWILHEKLICYHSPFFRKIFYSKTNSSKSFGLPEDEDPPFKVFVGWLYSSSLPVPREESDLGVLFDLYLMAEKFQIPALIQDVLQVVREWYKFSDTYPGLRRVQYVYANTEDGSPMRHMLVHSVARLLVLEDHIPQHWDKALRKNGQLAVDIIGAIQAWRLGEDIVPDARDDPAEAEEMLDEEVEQAEQENEEATNGGVEEGNDEEEVVEEDGEGDEEASADEDKTVVNSPGDAKRRDSMQVEKKKEDAEKEVSGGKKKAEGLSNGIDKLSLNEVPSGLTTGDYGTLAH